MPETINGIFLHHSTGNCIWSGGVPAWLEDYNRQRGTAYQITEQAFPKKEPYGWKNYPYDYWNIWVNHAGDQPFSEEPTLDMLTKENELIIWKHCFPVSHILEDTGTPDVGSEVKSLENYRAQYTALKEAMLRFPKTKFIVWTPAALLPANSNDEEAERTRAFAGWMLNEWDDKGDNIFVWDFHSLETEGGLFLKVENARSDQDPHPNEAFSRKAAPLFAQRIVDVLEGHGDTGSVTGG